MPDLQTGWKNPFPSEFLIHCSVPSSISVEKSETHLTLSPLEMASFFALEVCGIIFLISHVLKFYYDVSISSFCAGHMIGPFNPQICVLQF